MSQFCLRLLATMALLGEVCLLGVLSVSSAEAATGPNTWQLLSSVPARLQSPIEALAVDPGNHLVVVAGTQDGSIFRSADGGAHWTRSGTKMGQVITTITFNPRVAGQVLAGTGGAGIWTSTDDGAAWQPVPSTKKEWVRTIAASPSGMFAAGTHDGVLLSANGATWVSAGLTQIDISAVTIVSGGAQPVIVAGGDGEISGQPLPLYVTQTGGRTWTSVASSVSGSTMVASLLTLPPKSATAVPTVILGTNGGLFQSTDRGVHWAPHNGGGALPPVDASSLAVANGSQAYYVASDGGASSSGGLWVTRDGGNTFASLVAPQPEVTALAVIPGANPQIYAASFRPIDHAVMLWSYSDAGGTPQGPAKPVTAPKQHAATAPGTNPTIDWVRALSHGPELPFLLVSAFTVLILLLALAAYARSARRRL